MEHRGGSEEREGMASGIELVAPAAVTCRVPFIVSVEVRGVTPGRRITVVIEQKPGDGPARALKPPASVVAESDSAFVSFQLALNDRGTALLLATASDDTGASFHPDVVVVEVV